MRFKSSAEFVDKNRRLTPEALSALQFGGSEFKLVAIPTGTVGSNVLVTLQCEETGYFFIQNPSQITSMTLTRGSTILTLLPSQTIPISRGDVINFIYIMQATPANNPAVRLSPL